MGNFSIAVTCAQSATQGRFDLGLNLAINFNQAESRQAFNESLMLEPETCPMCWWGLAYSHAPFLNHPIKPVSDVAAGLAAAARAIDLAARVQGLTAKERGLVEAMGVRFPSTPQGNQTAAAIAYEAKLGVLHAALPDDDDVASLYAEASMLLECDPAGYNFYQPDGSPTALTAQVHALLRSVLDRAPSHPIANHLFIHLIEPSAPSLNTSALPAAAALAALYTGTDAQHLVHMPTHTYLRSGRYADVVPQNGAAHDSDARYLAHGRLPYAPAHNVAFELYGACMAGMRSAALRAASDLSEIYTAAPDRGDGPGPEMGWNLRLTTCVRFGAWADVVGADPTQPRPWPYATVLRLYANGTALAALGRSAESRAAFESLQAALPSVDPRYAAYARVAERSLRAAVAAAEGTAAGLAQAADALSQAVAEQASWTYDEPPAWHMPMRQCLGRVLLRLGDAANATAVYEADLAEFPRNGYSLFGLRQSMLAQPDAYTPEQVKAVEEQMRDAWKDADVPLSSSCVAFEGVGA